MASFNKVLLLGNLTRDPELRVTPKGTAICQFGLAVNRQFKDESGATRDETTFIDIEAWGKQGELVSKYLSKGSPCFIEGRLRMDTWEDKQSGLKRSRMKVVMENVQFLGSPKGGGSSGQVHDAPPTDTRADRHSSPPPPRTGARTDANQVDDDVPF
jgi:single-strand DNA-binding protein